MYDNFWDWAAEPFEFPDLVFFRIFESGWFWEDSLPMQLWRSCRRKSLRQPQNRHIGICVNFQLAWLATWPSDQNLEKQSMDVSADLNISTKNTAWSFPPDHSVKPVLHLSRYHCVKFVTLLDQCIGKWMQSLPSLVLYARPVFGRGAFHWHGG